MKSPAPINFRVETAKSYPVAMNDYLFQAAVAGGMARHV